MNDIEVCNGVSDAIQKACGMPEAEVAGALRAQYARVRAAAREMMRFGGMVATVEAALEGPRDGRDAKGLGLKGWLAEHCPEISYGTARRYRDLYRGAERQIAREAGVEMPAGLLLDAIEGRERVARPPELEHIEADVENLLEGRTARQLMFSFASEREPAPPAPPPRPMTPEDVERANTQLLQDILVQMAQFFRMNKHLTLTDAAVRANFRRELARAADLLK